MYLICWESSTDADWEIIAGEDAMQIRVNVIMETQKISAEEIHVFDMDDEIK